jgi:NAD(P)-dependent dehydrogenase (short-subunit alcohol dehydrogenase family)
MKIDATTALVTGANRGVGRAFVAGLLGRGARRVYAAARNLDSLADTLALNPQRVTPLQLDVTAAGQIEAARRLASDVNLLVNNAGSLTFGGALDVTQGGLNRDMSVNNDGLREVTRAFAPVIESNGGGAVINMLTLLSFVSAPGFSGYNASKAAAWSMSMSFRPYLKTKNIQVINAFPAGIDTEMLAGVDAPKDRPEDVVRDILDGVEADLEDIYPASAAEVFTAWRTDQKAVEAIFAGMM